uniref:Uncharacterized protein n=1 Tax=viral metagenome TaxID=1070528 RepID=A0A6M3XWR6_9ZZZZ
MEMSGNNWYVTAAGTNAGATATKAAVTGGIHVITDVYFFSDKDGTLLVYDGTTVVIEAEYDISNEVHATSWTWPKAYITGMNLQGTLGGAVSATYDASTADCRITITGYTKYY